MYIGGLFTLGLYAIIPTLRKLLTDNVHPSLFGSLYAIPALIEGCGIPLGGIIYNSLFEIDPLNSQWIFYGVSMGFVAGVILFTALSFKIKIKYLQSTDEVSEEVLTK